MTPQEQYPKFYQKPHLWIGASMKLECIEDFKTSPSCWGKKGDTLILEITFLQVLLSEDALDYFKPIFKPQEGEQFIKDLEDAVSAGCKEDVTKNGDTKWNLTFTLNLDEDARITIIKTGLSVSLSRGVTFDTAAYTDRLRELGYYL